MSMKMIFLPQPANDETNIFRLTLLLDISTLHSRRRFGELFVHKLLHVAVSSL